MTDAQLLAVVLPSVMALAGIVTNLALVIYLASKIDRADERVNARLDLVEERVNTKLDVLTSKVVEIDNRVTRIEERLKIDHA